MSRIMAGEKCKVYIEMTGGEVFEMTSYITSLSLWTSFDNQSNISMEAVGIEPGIWSQSKDYHNRLKANRGSTEWKCSYCGRPNSRVDETCKSCGSVRSFVYD